MNKISTKISTLTVNILLVVVFTTLLPRAGAKPDPSVGERRDDQDDLPREQGGDGLSLLDPYKKVVFEYYLINYLWWGEYS